MHDGAFGEGILAQAAGGFQEVAHGLYAAVHLEHARVHHCASHFHHIAEAGDYAVDKQRVAVGEREAVHVEFLDIMNAVLLALLTDEAHALGEGIAGETAAVFEQALHALVGFHFIEHRTLDLTADFNETIVGTYDNDIVILQAHVAARVSVDEVIIDVDGRNLATATVDLDIAERTDIADAACGVQGIES